MRRRERLALFVALAATSLCLSAMVGVALDCPDPVNAPHYHGQAVAIAAAAGHAYAMTYYDYYGYETSLRVIDVSDPGSPQEVGTLEWSADDIAASGGYVYTASGTLGLWVIDVSDPSAPHAVGSVDVGSDARSVAVRGRYAYVATYDDGLRVIDVANPSSPVVVGYLDAGGSIFLSVAVSGTHVYVTGFRDEESFLSFLKVIDVSDPTAPVEVGSLEFMLWYAADVAVSGRSAFVPRSRPESMGGADELMVIDVSDPSAPTPAGSLSMGANGWLFRVEVASRRAYVTQMVAGWQSKLWVIDVRDPSHPAALSVVDDIDGEPLQGSYDIARSGHFLYVAGGNGEDGVMVFDVAGCGASQSDPLPPPVELVPPAAD